MNETPLKTNPSQLHKKTFPLYVFARMNILNPTFCSHITILGTRFLFPSLVMEAISEEGLKCKGQGPKSALPSANPSCRSLGAGKGTGRRKCCFRTTVPLRKGGGRDMVWLHFVEDPSCSLKGDTCRYTDIYVYIDTFVNIEIHLHRWNGYRKKYFNQKEMKGETLYSADFNNKRSNISWRH